MSNTWEEDQIKTIIDRVLESRDRMVRCEIDASCCRTKHDWDKLHEAQDNYETVYSAAISDILAMINGPKVTR